VQDSTHTEATLASLIRIRRASDNDTAEVADLYWSARQAAVPEIPPPVHTRNEIADWIGRVMLTERRTWVATDDEKVVGVLALEDPDLIDQLYVEPGHQGAGIGSELLALALGQTGGRARAWCFQSNVAARRFYERHGFVPTAETDGDNEEGAPDVLYERL
jgi:GNAT superfamily N-acetyltransferase